MALETIKGQNVAFYVEKTEGSGTYQRVNCTGDVSLDIDTESDEATCADSEGFKEFEPGMISWSGSANLTARQATADDATTNVTAENFVDYQLGSRKIKIRFSLGVAAGSARYEGLTFITKNGLKGQNKGVATGAVSFQGTGPLTKTLVPA